MPYASAIQTALFLVCAISLVVAIKAIDSRQAKDSPPKQGQPQEDGLRVLCSVFAAALSLVAFRFLVAEEPSIAGVLRYGLIATMILLSVLMVWTNPPKMAIQSIVVLLSLTPGVSVLASAKSTTKLTPEALAPALNLAAAFAFALYVYSRIRFRLAWSKRSALLAKLFRGLVVGAGIGTLILIAAPIAKDELIDLLASLYASNQVELSVLIIILALLAGAFVASNGRTLASPFFNDPTSLSVVSGTLLSLWIGSLSQSNETPPTELSLAFLLRASVILTTSTAAVLVAQKSYIWGLWSRNEPHEQRRMTDPITDPSQDLLGRQHFALHLQARVERLFDAGGAILLSGPFGSGKSSILSLLELQFREDRSVRILRLGVSSRKEGKEILASVLAEVADDLSAYVGSWSARRMMRRYAEVFDLIPKAGDLRKALALFFGNPSASEIRSQIEDDLQRIGLKYVIIIEDLDRLEGEVSTFVVRALIPLFRWRRTVVIIAADQEDLLEQMTPHAQESAEPSND